MKRYDTELWVGGKLISKSMAQLDGIEEFRTRLASTVPKLRITLPNLFIMREIGCCADLPEEEVK